MDVRESLNTEDNLELVAEEGAYCNIENDSFFARVPPQAASTVGRPKSRRYLQEETETGSFLDNLPDKRPAPPVTSYRSSQEPRSSANQKTAGEYGPVQAGGLRAELGAGKLGDEWSVVNAWCRENSNTNDFDTDGKSSLGILNVDDMDLSSNNLLLETPVDEMLRVRGGPDTFDNLSGALNKPSIVKSSESSRLLEGSSSNQELKGLSSTESSRLLEGSSSNQELKGLSSIDSNNWQQDGSSSNSQDSKRDHPFARSQLGTVKKASGVGSKPIGGDPVAAAIKQSLFGQLPIGEVTEEADMSVHDVKLGADDLRELDRDFGEMECSIGEDSDREECTTPTNKEHLMSDWYMLCVEEELASIYLRHGLTSRADGKEQDSKKLTYLSKVALFDENGNDFNSGSELDTEDELEIARKGMRHEAAGEDSGEESTRPGLEGGCSDSCEHQLPITQRQSAEGIVVSPVPGDGGGGGDGSSGSESDDGRRSGIADEQQSNINYAGSLHFLQKTGNEEQRIRPMGDDLLSEMRQSRYASTSTTLDNEDSRLQSRYLRPISPADDPTPDNFRIEEFLSSPNQSEQQEFDPGNRLEASGFNANDAKESNSNPFGVMESSFGSFGLGSPQSGDPSLTTNFGLPFNLEARNDTSLHRFSGGQNISSEGPPRCSGGQNISSEGPPQFSGGQNISSEGPLRFSDGQNVSGEGLLRFSGGQNISGEAWERMVGSNRTSATSRSGSMGTQYRTSPGQGPSPVHSSHSLAGSQERLPSMPERGSKDSSLGELGERTAASGSLGRSSGGLLASTRSASPVSGYSSEGSDPGPVQQYAGKEKLDAATFKVPTMPAPKSGFKSSTTKSKTKANQKTTSSGSGSGRSSTRNSTQLDTTEGIDLAYRISLTDRAEEQKEGLKRVPSTGGTSQLDLTVPDTEFFGLDVGLQMLEMDEKQFEEDNVFRQDDAMKDTGSPNDSWAYQSIQSVARPSWMEPGDDEETLHVRISVGTFMRGRTEVLGSLEGDSGVPRPDFGMAIKSPPKVSARPHGLIDIEESRTSGVGENSNGESEMKSGQDNADDTLTLEALSTNKTAQESTLSVSAIDLAALGISAIDKTIQQDSSALTMDDVSMFFKTNRDPTKIVEGLSKLRDSKHRSTAPPKSNPHQFSQSSSLKSKQPVSPSKASSLPVRKGSNLSRSFPRVSDVDRRFETNNIKNTTNGDLVLNENSKADSVRESRKNVENVVEKTATVQEVPHSLKVETQGEPAVAGSLWTSPPRASLCPETTGVLEKLQEFSFRFSTAKMNDEKQDISCDLREKFVEMNVHKDSVIESYVERGRVGERETPPPDGQAFNGGSNNTQTMQTSLLRDGLSGMSDVGARPKLYDSGFNSVTDSQFRDSSLSRQRDLLNSELKSAFKSRSLVSSASEGQSIDFRDKDSNRSSVSQCVVKSTSVSSSSHVGFVPGHHVPDGTEYSHQSDYSHMDHKGMSRDDLEGTADIGLADSRGFDAIKGTRSQISAEEMERSLRRQIQYERDKEQRLENFASSERNVGDITAPVSQIGQSKPPLNLQPSQSSSPFKHSSRSNIVKQINYGDERRDVTDDHKTVETQTPADRHESWTQTSVVLQESVGLQPDNVTNGHAQTDDNLLENTTNVSSTSESKTKHNALQTSTKDIEKPLLLSRDSLLKTDFAQEYLKRDFSREVMDRIYSSCDITRLTQHQVDTHIHNLNGRESIESISNWTNLKPNDTMDSVYDESRIGQRRFDLTHPSFYHNPPTACSTPFPSRDLQTTLTPSSMHTLPSTGYRSMVASETNYVTGKTSDRGMLCPVKAPGVLKFTEACVVGISKTEILPLTNPTDRWLECILKVKSVEIDGRRASVESYPFEMRQKKIIIDPHKTEKVQVLFLPNRPGAFVAEVLVFSQSFLRNENATVDGIPVSVTFQAIAEKPKIVVSCDDDAGNGVIPFGELSWGMVREKTVCLRNQGHAKVPLRLAIVSEGAWHCFSFEPEGRTSDVSIISGRHLPTQTRSVINLELPGCSNSPFNYQEVKVWCRPPDKNCDRAMARLPAEQFQCKIDVELDIPYSKVSVCRPLRLEATVGVHKLHIQSNIKELQLSATPGKTSESGFKIYNAGNLELNLTFWFLSHSDLFTVKPETMLALQPAEEANLTIKFAPSDEAEQRFSSLLIMMVQPQGPMFEVQIQGDVLSRRRKLDLMCDNTNMEFGGVALGQTSLKRFCLINKDTVDVTLTLRTRCDDFELYKSRDIQRRGVSVLDLLLKPEAVVPVYVLFSPSTTNPTHSKVVMKSEQSDRKFTVHVSGYGGVSRLCCSERSTEPVSIKGHPCIGVRNLSTERVKHFYVNNLGARSASVKVAAFTDLSCVNVLPAGQVIVQPGDFIIDSQGSQKVEVVISMSEREFSERCRTHSIGAALRFTYQDKVDSSSPHKSELVVGLIDTCPVQDSGIAVSSLSMTAGANSTTLGHKNVTTSSNQTASRLSHTTSLTQKSEKSVIFSEDESGWALTPEELVLYCPTGGREAEVDMFHISNRQDKDLSFEISWPGDMITVKPGRGTVKSRGIQKISISASKEVKDCLDQLPWRGMVVAHCNKQVKTLKVELRRETILPRETPSVPVVDNQSLVPVGASHTSQSVTGSNKLGNLEISGTTVKFSSTQAGKISEEALELKNLGKDTIRWMFSSFAAPYLRKKADNSKEMFRVSYKVFDFSHQFGKLNGYSTVQLVLQFMPRSTGTFSQYWDIQTTGNSSNNSQREEYIRVHLTGEGIEGEEPKQLQSVAVEEFMSRSKPEQQRLKLRQEVLRFPGMVPGSATTMKVDLKNGYLEEVKVEVTEPKPPFYIKHRTIKIDKKRYLRFPVEFEPSRPGSYTDVVKFQSSKGENLILKVEGQCK